MVDNFEGDKEGFEGNSVTNREPMEFKKQRCHVGVKTTVENQTSSIILNRLELFCGGGRKISKEGVAVIQF